MKVAFVTTDNRSHFKDFANPTPQFGMAPEAVLHGFASIPNLEVHVVTCTRQPLQSPEKLADNIWFHSLHVPKLGWMRTGYQGCIRAVRARLRHVAPDIVHGQGTELDCAMDAVFSGFPNVITLHGIMSDMARVLSARVGSFYWVAAQLEKIVLRRTAGVFCNSSHTEARVRGRTRRTWRVPNALRPEFFSTPRLRPRAGSAVLLHVGVVCENKQQLEMLTLAEALWKEHPNFQIRFIGKATPENPYAAEFLRRLRKIEPLGFARHLHAGSIRELVAEFDEATALVHTPMAEAFGLVIAEAMARELKVFAFEVGGVADVLQGAADGILVPAGDWALLRSNIGAWLRSGAPAANPSVTLAQSRFHPEVVARRHLEIYEEVLATRQERRHNIPRTIPS